MAPRITVPRRPGISGSIKVSCLAISASGSLISLLRDHPHITHAASDADADVFPTPFTKQIQFRIADSEVLQANPFERRRKTGLTERDALPAAVHVESQQGLDDEKRSGRGPRLRRARGGITSGRLAVLPRESAE